MQYVDYVPLREYLDQMHMIDESASDVDTFNYTLDGHTTTILYYNNRHPRCYTSLNDNVLVFDAFDLSEETPSRRLNLSHTASSGWRGRKRTTSTPI